MTVEDYLKTKIKYCVTKNYLLWSVLFHILCNIYLADSLLLGQTTAFSNGLKSQLALWLEKLSEYQFVVKIIKAMHCLALYVNVCVNANWLRGLGKGSGYWPNSYNDTEGMDAKT